MGLKHFGTNQKPYIKNEGGFASLAESDQIFTSRTWAFNKIDRAENVIPRSPTPPKKKS